VGKKQLPGQRAAISFRSGHCFVSINYRFTILSSRQFLLGRRAGRQKLPGHGRKAPVAASAHRFTILSSRQFLLGRRAGRQKLPGHGRKAPVAASAEAAA
jgi:hypothetical protein